MSEQNYYEALGVDRSASKEELKSAYRKLAMQFHPDKNIGDKDAEEKFKTISEAYEILSNDDKRSQYDRFGTVNNNGSHNFSRDPFADMFGNLGDIFGQTFGVHNGGFNRVHRGMDLRSDITIEFMEAINGVDKIIDINKHSTCDVCNGSGSKPGTGVSACKYCGGTGMFVTTQGPVRMQSTCPHCQGQGQVITNPCSRCNGSGLMIITKKLNVHIPAGVDNDSKLKISGEGDIIKNGAPGDLYVIIHVKPHKYFVRSGLNILYTKEISFVQAALGDEIIIPTLTGEQSILIMKGIQNDDRISIEGGGIKHGSQCGNQIVQIKIKTPTNLSAKQETLLREFNSL